MWIWLQVTSTALPGADHAAATDVSPALLKELSLIRTYRCHLAPHRCEDQVECRVIGPTCVASSSRPTPKMSGKYVYMARSPSLTARWVLRKRIKAATTRCHQEVWMHLAHAKTGGDRTAQYKQSDHSRN